MKLDKSTSYGAIDISLETISSVVSNSTCECYGVVEMASKNQINEINNFFKKGCINNGVAVRKNKSSIYEIDVFIIVAYGVRITEIVNEVQKKVKYDLERKFNIKFKAINVYVQGIKNI